MLNMPWAFKDEVWWSRVTQPHLQAWADADAAWRLVEQTAPKDDPDRKALACYGLLVSCPGAPETLPEQVWLRFVEERPVSAVTTQYLESIRKLSCHTGCWHRRTGRRPASWLIFYTSECARYAV